MICFSVKKTNIMYSKIIRVVHRDTYTETTKLVQSMGADWRVYIFSPIPGGKGGEDISMEVGLWNNPFSHYPPFPTASMMFNVGRYDRERGKRRKERGFSPKSHYIVAGFSQSPIFKLIYLLSTIPCPRAVTHPLGAGFCIKSVSYASPSTPSSTNGPTFKSTVVTLKKIGKS